MTMPRVRVAALLLAACTTAGAQDATSIQRLLAAGDAAAALERATAAVVAAPRDARVAFLRGVALMDLRRDDEALQQFRRVAQEHPELAEPHNNIALLQARAGRLDEALASLQTALRNDPANAAARANLGDVHLRLAIAAWQQAASAAPADAALAERLRRARDLAGTAR
jgi:Flp pilus assembly protein TadD